jgi:hypothetical protein
MLREGVAHGSQRSRNPSAAEHRSRARLDRCAYAPQKETLAGSAASRRRAPECRSSAGGGRTSCKVPMALVREGRCRRSTPARPAPQYAGARVARTELNGAANGAVRRRPALDCARPVRACADGLRSAVRVTRPVSLGLSKGKRPGWTRSATRAVVCPGAPPIDMSVARRLVRRAAAGLAQLVERRLPKPKVASSRLVSRSDEIVEESEEGKTAHGTAWNGRPPSANPACAPRAARLSAVSDRCA